MTCNRNDGRNDRPASDRQNSRSPWSPERNPRSRAGSPPATTREPSSTTVDTPRAASSTAMSTSASRSPQAVLKPASPARTRSARQNPASSRGPTTGHRGRRAPTRRSAPEPTAAVVPIPGRVSATRRPPRLYFSPAETTRSGVAPSTPSGITAPVVASSNLAKAASVHPGVAFQPAARRWITSPVVAWTPAVTHPTSPAPAGARTNRTSSARFQGSSYSQPSATTTSQPSGRFSRTLSSVSSSAPVLPGVGITIDNVSPRSITCDI